MYFILLHFVGKRSGVARFQRALAGTIAPQKSKAKAQVLLARYIREKQFSVKCISIARPVENIMRFRYIVVPLSRDRKVFPFRNNIYDVSPRDTITPCNDYVFNVGISIIDLIVNIVATTCLKVRRIGSRWRKLDVSSVSAKNLIFLIPWRL